MTKNKKSEKPSVSVDIGSNVDPTKISSIEELNKDYITTVTVGTNDTSIKSRNSLVGKIISINLKKETYFGVGNIWLSPENYWATIPDSLSDQEYDIIYKSLQNKTIKLGKEFIPPVDKASNVKEKYWALLEKSGFENKSAKSAFQSLIRKGSEQGWTAIEIAQFCLSKEQAGKKRKEVVRLLEQLIKNYNGPIQLYDPPDEAEGLKKIIIHSDGMIEAETNSGKKVAKPLVAKPPEGHVKGNKTAEQAMNDLIN